MLLSQLIAGILLVLIGIALIITAFFTTFVLGIYGLIALGVGIALLLNRKEDHIEKAKVKLY